MVTLEFIQRTLATADNWSRKNAPAQAQSCIEGAVNDYLSLAVERFDGPRDAVEWMRANAVGELLDRCRRNLAVLCGEVDAGRLPESVIGGNSYYFRFSAMAACLGLFELCEWFIRVAARPDVLELSTRFWCEYAHGSLSLVDGTPYRIADFGRLARLERYWLPYLELMSAASLGEPLAPALDAINDSFVKRNRDKRINEPCAVDGSGDEPVRWDFRRDGLLAYIAHTRPELVR